MPVTIGKLLAMVLALMGPPAADAPKDIQLKPGDKVIFMGDYNTEGDGTWAQQVQTVLSKQYPTLKLAWETHARPDWRAEHVVGAINYPAPNPKDPKDKPKAAFLIVCVGASDAWERLSAPLDDRQVTAFKDYVNRIADAAAKAKIPLILVTPPLLGEDAEAEGNVRLAKYADVIKQVAAEKKCLCIDAHQILLNVLAKKPADITGRWLTTDGAHLSPVGQAVIAASVLRTLGASDEKMSATDAPVLQRR